MVLWAVPPVPIAAFSDQQLFIRELLLLGAGRRSAMRVEVPCFGEVVPGEVIFRRSDPHVEVGVDPRSRNYAGKSRAFVRTFNRLRNCEGLNLRIGGNRTVKAAKKLAS